MTPGALARYCGPQALAAAVGGGPLRAARSLLAMQRLRGRPSAPFAHADDLALLAMRAGLKVERWTVERPAPRLIESAGDLGVRLLAELERDRKAPPGYSDFQCAWAELAPTIPDPMAMVEGWRHRDAARCFTLAEWLNQPGLWLLMVRHALLDGVPGGHFVMVSDGRVVAGDSETADRHGALALGDAYKLFSPDPKRN